MLLQDGTPQVVGGMPGLFWQVQTNPQLVINLIDLGMSLEARYGESVMRSLRERGHTVQPIGGWAAGGAAQVIRIDGGMLTGGGDPRPGTSSVIGY